MEKKGGERALSFAALPPASLLPLLLLPTFPRWPSYEDARLFLLGALAPLPALFWALALRKGRSPLPAPAARTGLAFWTAGILLSFSGPGLAAEKIVGTAYYLGLFSLFLAGSALGDEKGTRTILLFWALAGAVTAAVGILQALGWDPLGMAPPWEAGSLLGNRNAASEVCAVLSPALAGLFLFPGKSKTLRRAAALSLFLLLFYAGLTRTRAGAVALAAGLGAALFLPATQGKGKFRRASTLLLFGACLLWLGGRLLSPQPPARPGREKAQAGAPRSILPSTWKVRLLLWKSAGRMALARPLTGWGAGSFEREFPPWRSPEEIRISSLDHSFETRVNRAHSDPLQVFVETGALGLAGWLLLLFGSLAAGWKKARRSPLAAGLFGTCVGFAVNGLFRSPLYNAPAAAAAFTALGILAALPRPGGEKKGSSLLRIAAFLPFLLLLYPAWKSLEAFRAQCLLAEALGAKNRKSFLENVEAALAADPESPTALQLLSRDLLERGTPRERGRVPALLERALQVRPYDVVTLRSRAEILLDTAAAIAAEKPRLARETLQAAVRDLEKALALDPGNPSTLALLGRVREAAGDVPGAIRAWKEISGKFPKALLERSKDLEKQGKEEMSCLFLQAWLEDNPGRAEYWRSLARRWRKLGKNRRADYCQGRAHRVWAVQALKNGDLRLAATHIRLYDSRAEEGDPGPVLLKAILALLQKNPKKAAALAKTLPHPNPPLSPADLQDLQPWLPLLRKSPAWAPLLPRPNR
ncbi:MAG TPA: hypothetical protein ENJ97_05120 [Planctomycetes bacterium]|nr:hypothetical protein [Planctomycetota bacterium]